MIHELTILYKDDGGGYDVVKDGMSSGGGLTVGEMIEQVLSISAPASTRIFASGRARYPLKPPHEWKHPNPQMPVDDEGDGS